jgi:hypothetical protein
VTGFLRYAKAVLGALGAGVAVAVPAAADGHVTLLEWLGVAAAVLGVGGGVAAVPNKSP